MTEANKPKSFMRLLLWIAAGLVVLAGLAAVIVPFFIPWDKIKAQAEQKAFEITRHHISIGSIGFNIFKGIVIKDIRVENARGFSTEPLFSDQAVIVQYRLLPLLAGKVMIKAVILEHPAVMVEKAESGTFNFSDMIPAKGVKPAETVPVPAAVTATAQGPAKLPIELLISRLAVKNATLTYRDLKAKQTYSIDALNLEINNLTLAGITPVTVLLTTNIKAMGMAIPLNVDSSWRFQYAQEKFLLDSLNVTLPGIKVGAHGDVDKVMSEPVLNLAGDINTDFGAMLTAFGPALAGKLPAGFKMDGAAKVGFKAAGPAKDINALEVNIEDTVDVRVAMQGLNLPVKIAGKIGLAKSNVDLAQDITLPETQTDVVKDVNASGKIRITAALKGLSDPKKMELALQVLAQNLSATFQKKAILENVNAALDVSPDKVSLPALQGKLGGQPIKFSFSAKGFDLRDSETLKPANLKAQVDWALDSPMLDVDALLALVPGKKAGATEIPAASAAVGTSTSTTPAEAVPAAEKPELDAGKLIPAGVSVQGAANLGGLKFGKVKLGKMLFKIDLKKQVLNETGDIAGYQGNIHEVVRLDFTQKLLGYGVNAELKKVDVEPLLNDVVDTFVAAKLKKPGIISEIKDKLTGRLTGKLQINGAGITPNVAKPRLTGNGVFNLKDGRIRKFAFQDKLASLFGTDKFRQDIPFDNTAIEFTIAQQKLELTKFDLGSGPKGTDGEIRLWANGKIKFAAEFENFHLRPSLNPRATSNVSTEFRQYTEALKDENGWLCIPVLMNGPIASPSVMPDWDWIKQQFAGNAQKKVKNAVNDAGKKAQDFVNRQPGKSPDEIKQNVSQEVENAKEQFKNLDGLKNLFK
jgi:uncharacterized protein involved in outer membrane biogenesis